MNSSQPPWREVDGVCFLPAPDPLWHETPTPCFARYNVLGVPLEFATNAPALAALAEEVFGDWGTPERHADAYGARLHVFLQDLPEMAWNEQRPELICRAQESYLYLTAGHSIGFGDRATGFGAAFVTPAMAADRDTVKTTFLECLGMFLVCRYRRATLHAAAIDHEGRCVLLTGRDGVGKSTLAYACLRTGFCLLADDIVFAEAEAEVMTVWGNPWYLHLLPDAIRLFPELRAMERTQQFNGEIKLRVQVNGIRPGAAVTHRPVWGVCALSRSEDGVSRLLPADSRAIRSELTCFKGDPLLDRTAMTAAANRLVQSHTAHLQVGSDLDEAVAILRQWMETST